MNPSADLQEPPEAAPRTGVVAVRWMDGQNRPLTDRFHDFYWSEPDYGGWDGGDTFGLCDYMARARPRPLVLFGRSVLTASFREIIARARRAASGRR